jgi:hypothetical protein
MRWPGACLACLPCVLLPMAPLHPAPSLPALLLPLLVLGHLQLPGVRSATELYRTSAPAALRDGGGSSSLGGGPVPIVVYDGESIEQVVRRTVSEHELPESSLAPLRQLVTERSLQAVGDAGLRRQLCRIPVSLTVPSQLSASGEGMQQGIMLTIYEDTEPDALAQQLAARYVLPTVEATKLRDLIEDAMLQRLRLRVAVSIGSGEKRTLAVRTGETAAAAAARFAGKFGLTEAATQRLTAHILQQLPGPDLVLTGDEWRA